MSEIRYSYSCPLSTVDTTGSVFHSCSVQPYTPPQPLRHCFMYVVPLSGKRTQEWHPYPHKGKLSD